MRSGTQAAPRPRGTPRRQSRTSVPAPPATELNIYLGNYEGLSWGRLPLVPGYAATFRVEAVGSGQRCHEACLPWQ